MKSVKVNKVSVVEGNLYEKYGEDSMIVCYDLWVHALVGDKIYTHKHTFKGMTENPDGFACPDYGAKPAAHDLAEKVRARGFINLDALMVNLPTGTADPTAVATGDAYYKTDTKELRIYDGTGWVGVTLA